MKTNHRKESLKFSNTIAELKEAIKGNLVSLICEYGKVTENDPNVYEIEIPEKDVFHYDDMVIGGKVSVDVSYYDGTIYLSVLNNKREKINDLDFDCIEDVRIQNFVYRLLALAYEPKK